MQSHVLWPKPSQFGVSNPTYRGEKGGNSSDVPKDTRLKYSIAVTQIHVCLSHWQALVPQCSLAFPLINHSSIQNYLPGFGPYSDLMFR